MLRRQGRALRRKALWIAGRDERYVLSVLRRARIVLFRESCVYSLDDECSGVDGVEISSLERVSKSNSSKRLQSACRTAPPPTATVIANGKPVSPNSRLRILLSACKFALESDSLVFREERKERRAGPRERESARVYVRIAT